MTWDFLSNWSFFTHLGAMSVGVLLGLTLAGRASRKLADVVDRLNDAHDREERDNLKSRQSMTLSRLSMQ